jgi:hypothetical protein
MLLLIWFVVGLLLGLVVRQTVALSVAAGLWIVATATVAARVGSPFEFGVDAAGVFVTLAVALFGAWLGAIVRARRPTHSGLVG